MAACLHELNQVHSDRKKVLMKMKISSTFQSSKSKTTSFGFFRKFAEGFFLKPLLISLLILPAQVSFGANTNNICKDPVTYSQELLQQELAQVFPDGWNQQDVVSFLGKPYRGSPVAADILEKIVAPFEFYSTVEEKTAAEARSWSFFTANAKSCRDLHCLYLDLFQNNEEMAQHALLLGSKYKIYLAMHPDSSVDEQKPKWSLYGLRLILKAVRELPSFLYQYSALKKIVQVAPEQSLALSAYNQAKQQAHAQITGSEIKDSPKSLAGLCSSYYGSNNPRHLIHLVVDGPEKATPNTRSLYHEFAHALEREMMYTQYLGGSQTLFQYHAEIKNTPQCKNSYVTEYSKTNQEEDFAETFQYSLISEKSSTEAQCKIQSMQKYILKNHTISVQESPLYDWIKKNIGCRAIAQFCAKKSEVFYPKADPQPYLKIMGANLGYPLTNITDYTDCLQMALRDHIFPSIPQCETPSEASMKIIESDLRKTCHDDIQSAFEALVQKSKITKEQKP